MKNLLLSALLVVTVVTSAFAVGENKISSIVLNSFKVDFKNARNVSWTSKTGFAKAAFNLNNREMEVFYNETGNIIATCTHIQLDELPVNAKRTFAKKFDGYTVKEAIKFEGTTEDAYYIKAENDQQRVILKVGEAEDLTFFQKDKKRH